MILKRSNANEYYGKESFANTKDLKKKEEELRNRGYSFVRKGNRRKIKPIKGNFHGLAWGVDEDTKVLVYYYTSSKLVFKTYYSMAHLW